MSEDAPLRKYEVEVSANFTAWVNVEASDKDEAHSEALDEARTLSVMDWNDDGMYRVESCTEQWVAS